MLLSWLVNSIKIVSCSWLITSLIEENVTKVSSYLSWGIPSICGPNEEFSFTGCDHECTRFNRLCTVIRIENHAFKCFCIRGFYRDNNGNCVELSDCPKGLASGALDKTLRLVPLHTQTARTTTSTPTPDYEMTCGLNQTYKSCEPCEKTCVEPNPNCEETCVNSTCEMACLTGCFCEDGYYKAPNGQCVLLPDCPKAEVMSVANEPSIEECQPDEVFVSCGWCEATCSQLSPDCPPDVCTRGCLCRPPLVRHRSGHCVEKRDCFGHTCTDRNEEYVCRYGCEPHCVRRTCYRQRRCSLGCHCKFGLLRDRDGRCVTVDQCQRSITQLTLNPEVN